MLYFRGIMQLYISIYSSSVITEWTKPAYRRAFQKNKIIWGKLQVYFFKLTSFKEPNCCSLYNIIEVDLLNAQLLPILMTLIFPLCLPSRKSLYKTYAADSLKNENSFTGNISTKNFPKSHVFYSKKIYICLKGNIEYLSMSILQILMDDISENSQTSHEHFFMKLMC